MVNHLSSIGFQVAAEPDFVRLAETALQEGVKVPADKGCYYCLAGGDGTELWLQTDGKARVIGLNPHFRGKSEMRIGLTKAISRASDSPLDGAFHGWAEPQGEGMEGLYPLIFDLPDSGSYGVTVLPQILRVQLSAFAHEISLYDNEEIFASAQQEPFRLAPQSFIPTGLFGETQEPGATAIFAGIVSEAGVITNKRTGVPFYWALVETLGGTVDVVADPRLLPDAVRPGQIVSGSYWLSGRLIDSPLVKAKSRLARWLGR